MGLALELVLALPALLQNLNWLLALPLALALAVAAAAAVFAAAAAAAVAAAALESVLVYRVGLPERGSLACQACRSQGGLQEEETDWAPALLLAHSLGCTQPDQAI